jgi:adenosine deaminase
VAAALVTRELLASLPKAELHCHLDGSLRVETILDLADSEGVRLPANDVEGLRAALRVGAVRDDLEDYLSAFAITNSVLQCERGLARAAAELVDDAAAENVRYLEVRFSPILHTQQGLTLEAVLEAVLAGLAEAGARRGVVTGVIVCSIRDVSPEVSHRLAVLAARYGRRGVVGFDLAGPEVGHPARAHRDAFAHALTSNLSCTVHAGEGDGPASISEAVHLCGAHRVGHGTRLGDDPALLDYVTDHRIPLEICLSSNVQTRAVRDFASHPVKHFHARGIRVTLNTDNRLMSDTTVTNELWLAHVHLGFTLHDLKLLVLNGFKSAFLHFAERQRMVQAAARDLGLHPASSTLE